MNGDAVNPPDERLQLLWMHMANLMGSDPSFRLASPNTELEVKQTLEELLDCQEKEEHTHQWHLLIMQMLRKWDLRADHDP